MNTLIKKATEKPTHLVNDTGHTESSIHSHCGLGDTRDRGFEKSTTDPTKTTCKRCIKALNLINQ